MVVSGLGFALNYYDFLPSSLPPGSGLTRWPWSLDLPRWGCAGHPARPGSCAWGGGKRGISLGERPWGPWGGGQPSADPCPSVLMHTWDDIVDGGPFQHHPPPLQGRPPALPPSGDIGVR